MEQRSRLFFLYRATLYRFLRITSRLLVVCMFDYRVIGRENMPAFGPVLVLSNHQSMLDPLLVGLIFDRQLQYLAKKSLFHNPVLRFIIDSVGTIPIDRERGGLEGLRIIISRLKEGRAVVLFPEGTRSRDGQLLPVKAGFIAVARRSHATLVPMAIVGANEVMRQGRWLPQRIPLSGAVGEPIPFEVYSQWDDRELVEQVAVAMRRCWLTAHQIRAAPAIKVAI